MKRITCELRPECCVGAKHRGSPRVHTTSRKMLGGASLVELVHRCSREAEGKFCLGFYWEL